MAKAILFSQCLQRDFVQPLAPLDPLPNALHVGHAEAERLLGVDPEQGPLAQLMHWARAQSREDLEIIHIRDWHDPADRRQASHLQRFGPHCLRGSDGAGLVLDLGQAVDDRANEQFVNSVTLNDFEGTRLAEVLEPLVRSQGDEAPRVGVVGVWTEAKVSFLLYELLTRCGLNDLATCSALTASASRSQHFNALEQLRKVLGVHVFDSVGDFAAWMLPAGERIALPSLPRGMRPSVRVDGAGDDEAGLPEADLDILSYLFRDSSRLALQRLGGGFSGADVYQVRSWDAPGHEQAPSVVKVGPRTLIAQERVAFEKVEAVLGNSAPSVRGFADLGDRAGLKYAYAAMGRGRVRTFKSLYEAGASEARIDAVLNEVFEEILGRFWAAAQYERLPLLEYYTFAPRFADNVRERVAEVYGGDGSDPRLTFVDGSRADNVARFYAEALPLLPRPYGEYHYVSYVHGDLNGANILMDGHDNVWLIDFFHAHRGHVLRDVAKLENDLLYIFTPLVDEADLSEALRISAALRQVQDLRAPLPHRVQGVTRPALIRAWDTLRTLRSITGRLCRDDRDPNQMAIALTRYAVHTLSFEQSSPLQRQWALASACGFAEDIVARARTNRALRVDWLEHPLLAEVTTAGGRIGLTLCPGRKDKERSVHEDVETLRAAGIRRSLSLLTDAEMEWAGVPELFRVLEAAGIEARHEPIADQAVPSPGLMRELVAWVLEGARAGDGVLIHCMGGLGRTGTVAAATLATLGADPEEAIGAVRRARGPRAVENADQAAFVRRFASEL